MNTTNKTYSRFQSIQNEIRGGASAREAIKHAGVSPATYYEWRRRFNKKSVSRGRNVSQASLPKATSSRLERFENDVMILIGSPQLVVDTLKHLQ